MLAPHARRYAVNLGRCAALIVAHKSLEKKGTSGDDILRAVVVLMHATVEDLLRTIGEQCLPAASESALNEIPWLGRRRGEKAQLGILAAHRGKQSMTFCRNQSPKIHYIEPFNNTNEIASLLGALETDLSFVQQFVLQ